MASRFAKSPSAFFVRNLSVSCFRQSDDALGSCLWDFGWSFASTRPFRGPLVSKITCAARFSMASRRPSSTSMRVLTSHPKMIVPLRDVTSMRYLSDDIWIVTRLTSRTLATEGYSVRTRNTSVSRSSSQFSLKDNESLGRLTTY